MRLIINCLLLISYLDSSKQRTRLRAKLTVSKAELKECINGLKVLHPEEEIDVESIEQGIFPWLDRSTQGKKTRLLPLVDVVVVLFIIIIVKSMYLYQYFRFLLPRAPIIVVEGKWAPLNPICTSIGHTKMGLYCFFPLLKQAI